MKNKTKKQSISKSKQTQNQLQAEWLYLLPQEVTVRDVMNTLIKDMEDNGTLVFDIQIWEDAGVLELEFPQIKSMVFEKSDPAFGDEESQKYFASLDTRSLFLVTIAPEHFGEHRQIMKLLVERMGGVFCADTQDFTPQVG